MKKISSERTPEEQTTEFEPVRTIYHTVRMKREDSHYLEDPSTDSEYIEDKRKKNFAVRK